MVCRIIVFMWSFGPLKLAPEAAAVSPRADPARRRARTMERPGVSVGSSCTWTPKVYELGFDSGLVTVMLSSWKDDMSRGMVVARNVDPASCRMFALWAFCRGFGLSCYVLGRCMYWLQGGWHVVPNTKHPQPPHDNYSPNI